MKSQSEEYEEKQHRENAEQSVNEEQAVAQTPERIFPRGVEETKHQDEADGDQREEIEDKKKALAGEVKNDIQGEHNQKGDS